MAIFGLSLLALGIVLAGPSAVLATLTQHHPSAILIAASSIAVGSLLGAWNVYRIAELRTCLPFLAFLPIFWRAWAIGLSVPGQVGDLVATIWQLRGRTESLAFLGGRLLADKAVTFVSMMLLLATLPGFLALIPFPGSLWLFATVLVGLFTSIVLLRWMASHPTLWRAHPAFHRLQKIARAMMAPWPALTFNFVITMGKLLLSGAAYWVLFSPPARPVDFPAILALSQAAGLVAYIPVSFNGLGTVELTAVHLFSLFAVEAPKVLAVYLLLRVSTLVMAWVPVVCMLVASVIQSRNPAS